MALVRATLVAGDPVPLGWCFDCNTSGRVLIPYSLISPLGVHDWPPKRVCTTCLERAATPA